MPILSRRCALALGLMVVSGARSWAQGAGRSWAQGAGPVRIRGNIAALDGNELAVTTRAD